MTIPLAVFLGLAQDPCTLDSYGVIPAALARQIAADATREHPASTTWRCIITDSEHRSVLALTAARRLPTSALKASGPGRVHDPGPLSTSKHDPPDKLTDLVRAALPRCVFPGCAVPAARCDLDHRIPYDHRDPEAGGPTCSCNLQPTCRTHHRLKTTGLITVEAGAGDQGLADIHDLSSLGALRWTSRAGLTYDYTPPPVTHPGDPDQADALREELHARRHPDPEPLLRANDAIRKAQMRARTEHNLAMLREFPHLLETWTDTIERPDPDRHIGWQRLDELDADDPYADLPLPPLDEPEHG